MPDAPLRIVFFGTPEFAVPSLRGIHASRHELVGVVSQPDRPRGRGRKLAPTPVREAADGLGVPLLQPEKVGDADALEWLRERAPDVGVVVAFGQFVPKKVRDLPRLEMINAHASLLPRWRGAAPIQWAIASGDEKTGISIMRVEKEMDAGDVCAQEELSIGPEETAGELTERLAALAAPALVHALDQIAAGRARFEPQDASKVTEAPKVDREFARLDWSEPAWAVLRRIQAATPRPGADVHLLASGRSLRILKARLVKPDGDLGEPGSVLAAHAGLRIAALDGWIEVTRLQARGRSPVNAADFLRGASIPPGERVGEPVEP